jgi:hypothetical protein
MILPELMSNPFLIGGGILISLLSLLTIVICLPMLTWLVWTRTKQRDPEQQPFADNPRLREIRARRESIGTSEHERSHKAAQLQPDAPEGFEAKHSTDEEHQEDWKYKPPY